MTTLRGTLSRRRKILLALGIANVERQTGIVRYAREAGWVIDFSLLLYHAVGEHQEYLDTAQYDGVLAICSKAAPWIPDLLAKFKVPIVDMWADYPELPYPRVLLDNVEIGRAGTRHLLAKGYKNLLFYGHAIEAKSVIARAQGFREAADAGGSGIQRHELIWDHKVGPMGRHARTEMLADWLKQAHLPVGVVGSKDQTASEVLEAAESAGLAVPRQVAVIGVDNDRAETELALVPLTSVDSARERVGYEAAKLLDQLIDGSPPPAKPILIPPGPVVARRSTDALAIRDPDIAIAIQFIQDHFHEPITAEDVAAEAGISSRHLLSRLLADTGRSVRDTIAWHRLEHAKGLLVSTGMKVQMVAQRSGFGTGENLCKVFRRMVGASPQKYRQRYGPLAEGPPQEIKSSPIQ
jgi:LacI family transcriptional regulator